MKLLTLPFNTLLPPYSSDYHLLVLSQTQTILTFCVFVSQKHLQLNNAKIKDV